ncbi:MAG: hypothetical protein ACQEWU_05185 [Bacillota bacterium]
MIYIVVKDVDMYADRLVFNEAVFNKKEKAIEYIKSKGFSYDENYEEYIDLKSPEEEAYRIEEWTMNTTINN